MLREIYLIWEIQGKRHEGVRKAAFLCLTGIFWVALACGGAATPTPTTAPAPTPTPEPPEAAAPALETIRFAICQGCAFVLSYLGGKDAGIFEKYGIDAEVDVRPFPDYLTSLPSRDTLVGTYSGTATIDHIQEGMDLVILGGGLTGMQRVFVPVDSPIQDISEIRGKKLGVWSTRGGAIKVLRALLIDEYNIDILDPRDVEIVEAEAPALYALGEKGDVDAMYQLSSLTIQAASQPDKFRSIFSPDEFWKAKTGSPVMWLAPIVAWRDWVEEDPDRAMRVVAALHETFEWLRDPENLQAAVDKYGEQAGVTSQEQADVYKEWLTEGKIFLTEWNQEVIDAQWNFLEVSKRTGVITEIPDKDRHALILN